MYLNNVFLTSSVFMFMCMLIIMIMIINQYNNSITKGCHHSVWYFGLVGYRCNCLLHREISICK